MADKSQVIVADATLAVQAQLVDVLSGAVNVTSVINAEQLWHRLEQGHGDTDLLILDAALVAPGLDVFCRKWLAAPETRAAWLRSQRRVPEARLEMPSAARADPKVCSAGMCTGGYGFLS